MTKEGKEWGGKGIGLKGVMREAPVPGEVYLQLTKLKKNDQTILKWIQQKLSLYVWGHTKSRLTNIGSGMTRCGGIAQLMSLVTSMTIPSIHSRSGGTRSMMSGSRRRYGYSRTGKALDFGMESEEGEEGPWRRPPRASPPSPAAAASNSCILEHPSK